MCLYSSTSDTAGAVEVLATAVTRAVTALGGEAEAR